MEPCLGFRMRTVLITHCCRAVLTLRQAPHTALPAGRLWVQQELGGGQTRTADPEWPKGCSIPYGTVLSDSYGGAGWGGGTTAWDWAGHHSVGGEQLHCAPLVLYTLLLLLLLFFLFCPDKLFLSQPTSFYFFQFSLPSHCGGRVSERLCGA